MSETKEQGKHTSNPWLQYACLVTAAPDLLEALRMVRGDIALSNAAHSLDPIVLEAVEAAISKAEGR